MKRTRRLGWVLVGAMVVVTVGAGAASAQTAFSEPTVPAEWKSKDAGQLVELAKSQTGGGAEQATNRGLLAQYVGYRFLNEAAQTRAVALTDWNGLAVALAKDLDDATKAKWRTALRAAYAANAAGVVALSDAEFTALTGSLRQLQDAAIPALTGQRVSGKFLVDAATIRSVGVPGWQGHVQACKDGLTEAERADWHAKLTAAFIPTPAAMAALADKDFTDLTYVLRNLVSTTSIPKLVVTRMTAKDLATTATAKALGVEELQKRTSTYAGVMTEEMKTLWRTRAREAFAANDAALTALSEEDFAHLLAMLNALKDPQVAQLKASRLTAKYLGDVAATRSVSLKDWSGNVSACKAAMSDETKALWITRLRAAYADAATLKTLSDDDFNQLIWTLTGLGDKDTKSLTIARMTASAMPDVATIRAKSPTEWQGVVSRVADGLTAEARAQWGAKLKEAFVNNTALAAMSVKDAQALVNTLRALKQETPESAYASWVTAGNGWQASGGADLLTLAQGLAKTGAAGQAARKTVADGLATTLADPAKAAAITLGQWDGLSRELAADLSAETKASWATGLKASFAGAESLNKLTSEGYTQLVTTLARLGDASTPALTKSWMAGSNAWQSLDMTGLTALAGRLGKLGQDGQTARSQLAAHLTARLTADPAAARAAGCQAWASLARNFTKDAVTADQRTALAAALRATFTANPADLANLKAGDFQQLVLGLKALGDTKTDELSQQYMKASEAWKGGNLSWFLQALPAGGVAAVDARKSLAAQVEAENLKNADAIRAVELSTWLAIAREVKTVLTPVASERWVAALRPALLPDGAGSNLSPKDFLVVAQILKTLGDCTIAATTTAWLTGHEEQSAALSTTDLMSLTMTISGRQSEELTAAMTKLDAAWQTKFAAGQATAEDCRSLCYAWCAAGNTAQGAKWATKMYETVLGSEAARAAADVPTLNMLVGAMHNAGMLDYNNQEYPGFAQAAARLAREGQLDDLGSDPVYRHWGMVLKMPQSRAIIAAEVADAEGLVRIGLSKIVAWSYREAKEAKQWQAAVDAKLADGSLSGDRKALWQVAKGYADALVPENANIPRRKEWLDTALASAESDAVRLKVVDEFAAFFADVERPDAGISVLESLKPQFGAASAAHIAGLQDRLTQVKGRLQVQAAQFQATQELALKRGELNHLRTCLGMSRAQGDTAAVAKWQAAIAQLETELGTEK